jgi:hypothetical protein
VLFLVYLMMLLFAHFTYFLNSDEYLVNNEEVAWQYAVINSRFKPGRLQKEIRLFLME